MKIVMHVHLKLITDEPVARKTKNYEADVAVYEKVHEVILKIAGMLSDGIIKQFRDKFKEHRAMATRKLLL